MKPDVVPFIYINLDRSVERRRYMEQLADRLSLASQISRYSAVDASVADSLTQAAYRPHRLGPFWELTPWEVAVFESHRDLWRRVCEERWDAAVIMEDDVLATKSLKPIAECLFENSSEFDVVHLDGTALSYRFGPVRRAGEYELRAVLQTIQSSACYIVSLEGARRLLHESSSYCDHIDDFIFRPRRGWRCYQLWPAVAVQGMFVQPPVNVSESSVLDSERTANASKLRSVSKGPIWYRISKEPRRVHIRLKRKLGGDRRLFRTGGLISQPPLADGLPPYK